MATFTFYKSAKLIEIDETCGTVATIQELICAIRPQEATLCYMDIDRIMDGTGKDDLGALGQTAPTLRLLNDWRVKAADRCGPSYTTVTILGGNLVATNSFCNSPIAPASFVTTVISQALSASVSTSIELDVAKTRRYLTNKKNITGNQLIIRNDDDTADNQTYTLDDGDNPKSQTPV